MKYILLLFALFYFGKTFSQIEFTEEEGSFSIMKQPTETFKGTITYRVGGKRFADSCDVVCRLFRIGFLDVPDYPNVNQYSIQSVFVNGREIPEKAWEHIWVDGWRIYDEWMYK